MARLSTLIGFLGILVIPGAAASADLREVAPLGAFRATCEDLGTFCFAEACGRDQIEAAQDCQARCPSAAIMSVVPAACPRPEAQPHPVLRRRS